MVARDKSNGEAMVARGKSNGEIAGQLTISPGQGQDPRGLPADQAQRPLPRPAGDHRPSVRPLRLGALPTDLLGVTENAFQPARATLAWGAWG